MAPEMALGLALAALQAVIAGILLWLVQRVGELSKSQAIANEALARFGEWKGTHDPQDRETHAEIRSEMRTRFESVDKIEKRVAELEFRNRLHATNGGA